MADRIDLNKYEKGLATLEGILNQGLRIIPDDTMESKSGIKNILPPASGQYDKATARQPFMHGSVSSSICLIVWRRCYEHYTQTPGVSGETGAAMT